MLENLTVLTVLYVGAAFPLCLWINHGDTIQAGFHRFTLGLGGVLLGFGAAVVALTMDSSTIRVLSGIAGAGSLSVAAYYWNRESAPALAVTFPSLAGLALASMVLLEHLPPLGPGDTSAAIGVSVLGAVSLSASLYAMVLGHWYLNVERMPIRYLSKVVFVYGSLLALRLGWDLYAAVGRSLDLEGFQMPILPFIWSLDGFLVLVAVFFGILFPLVLSVMTERTLAVKSTQSATGILYVVVSAAIIGDVTFKFYLLRYGLAL